MKDKELCSYSRDKLTGIVQLCNYLDLTTKRTCNYLDKYTFEKFIKFPNKDNLFELIKGLMKKEDIHLYVPEKFNKAITGFSNDFDNWLDSFLKELGNPQVKTVDIPNSFDNFVCVNPNKIEDFEDLLDEMISAKDLDDKLKSGKGTVEAVKSDNVTVLSLQVKNLFIDLKNTLSNFDAVYSTLSDFYKEWGPHKISTKELQPLYNKLVEAYDKFIEIKKNLNNKKDSSLVKDELTTYSTSKADVESKLNSLLKSGWDELKCALDKKCDTAEPAPGLAPIPGLPGAPVGAPAAKPVANPLQLTKVLKNKMNSELDAIAKDISDLTSYFFNNVSENLFYKNINQIAEQISQFVSGIDSTTLSKDDLSTELIELTNIVGKFQSDIKPTVSSATASAENIEYFKKNSNEFTELNKRVNGLDRNLAKNNRMFKKMVREGVIKQDTVKENIDLILDIYKENIATIKTWKNPVDKKFNFSEYLDKYCSRKLSEYTDSVSVILSSLKYVLEKCISEKNKKMADKDYITLRDRVLRIAYFIFEANKYKELYSKVYNLPSEDYSLEEMVSEARNEFLADTTVKSTVRGRTGRLSFEDILKMEKNKIERLQEKKEVKPMVVPAVTAQPEKPAVSQGLPTSAPVQPASAVSQGLPTSAPLPPAPGVPQGLPTSAPLPPAPGVPQGLPTSAPVSIHIPAESRRVIIAPPYPSIPMIPIEKPTSQQIEETHASLMKDLAVMRVGAPQVASGMIIRQPKPVGDHSFSPGVPIASSGVSAAPAQPAPAQPSAAEAEALNTKANNIFTKANDLLLNLQSKNFVDKDLNPIDNRTVAGAPSATTMEKNSILGIRSSIEDLLLNRTKMNQTTVNTLLSWQAKIEDVLEKVKFP